VESPGSKLTGCGTARRAREPCYAGTCGTCPYGLHKACPACGEVGRTWWTCCFNEYCPSSLS